MTDIIQQIPVPLTPAPTPESAPVTPAGASPPAAEPAGAPASIAEARQALRYPALPPTSPEEVVTPPATAAEPLAPAEGEPIVPGEVPGGQDATTEPQATLPAVPQGHVVLDIPEGHPLRDRGKTQLPPIPAEWEPEFRNFLNDPVRRSDLSSLDAQLSETRQRALQWERVAGFYVDRVQKLFADPAVAIAAAELREERGDAVADAFIQGHLNQDEGAIREILAQTGQEYTAYERQQKAEIFVSRAQPALAKHFPLLQPQQMNQLLISYGNAIDQGQYGGLLSWPGLKEFVGPYYETLPQVVEQRRAAISKSEAESRAAEEAQRKAAEEAAALHQARVQHNPLGRMPRVGTSSSSAQVTPAPGQANVRDIRRGFRRGA